MRYFAFLLLLISNSINGQDAYIKLNLYDCVACTNGIEAVMNVYPNTKIALEEKYIDDSVDIFEKFGLESYRTRVIWSDTLYNRLSAYVFSEVIVNPYSGVSFRDTLKGLNIYQLKRFAAEQKACPYKLPKSINKIGLFSGAIILSKIEFYKFYCLPNTDTSTTDILLTDNIIRDVYKLANREQEYNNYIKIKKLPMLKATILHAEWKNNILAYCKVPIIDEIRGDDTVYSGTFVVLKINRNKSYQIYPIDKRSLPNGYAIDENSFYSIDDSLYVGLTSSVNADKTPSKFLKCAVFGLKNSSYKYSRAIPHYLPQYMIDYKINYNCTNLYFHSNYYTFPFSNRIYDLKSQHEHIIPFSDSLLREFSSFMSTYKAPFTVWEVRYRRETDDFALLYVIGGDYYVSTLKKSGSQFLSTRRIISEEESKKQNRAISLSFDGKYVVILPKNSDCLLQEKI